MINTLENTQNTNRKTSESEAKWPLLKDSQTLLQQEQALLAERGLIKGFQHKDTHTISNNNECKRSLKRKKTPNYRLITNYYKSLGQYWKERNRRKQAWKLLSEGWTQTRIAEKLNVSSKTVSHDLGKVSAYYTGQFNTAYHKIRNERDAEYMKRLDSMTHAEKLRQFKQMSELMLKVRNIKKKKQSTINVILEVEEILRVFADGGKAGDKPIITVPEKRLYTSFTDLRIHFMLRAGDKLLGYRTLTFNG